MSTEKPSGLPTSTAILLGSCVIALGLYFGLRGRNEPPAPLPMPAPVSAPNVGALPTSETGPVKAQPPNPAPDKKRIVQEASTSLDKHKKTLTEKCLAPSLAKKPQPAMVKYTFNITFDASGKLIARGVAEDRETARPEVLACISENFPELQVTAPGQSVLVDVPFELP